MSYERHGIASIISIIKIKGAVPVQALTPQQYNPEVRQQKTLSQGDVTRRGVSE